MSDGAGDRGLAALTQVPPLPLLAALAVGGTPVADYVDGGGLPAQVAPRPFLHPVRTLSGAAVTDAWPTDHRWHLGAGVAVQDVAGTNLWGGRTYVRDAGYVWLPDHGIIRQVTMAQPEEGVVQAHLEWRAPAGQVLLQETRTMRASSLEDAGPAHVATGAWLLELTFTLANPGERTVELGSPATHGRPGAGYGGFFWRLPPLTGAQVRSADAAGEAAVHGSRSAWLAISGILSSGDEVTLVAAQPGTRDPWFVRLSDYPGFGASLAAADPVPVAGGASLTRSLRVIVADGTPDAVPLGEQLAGGRPRERTAP